LFENSDDAMNWVLLHHIQADKQNQAPRPAQPSVAQPKPGQHSQGQASQPRPANPIACFDMIASSLEQIEICLKIVMMQ
jgi:hypothetical protein